MITRTPEDASIELEQRAIIRPRQPRIQPPPQIRIADLARVSTFASTIATHQDLASRVRLAFAT